MDKFVLIDGNSLLNRAYYATPIFTTRSGMPTNAIFGFIKLMFKILDDIKPKYIAVAFDLKAPTFRHKMYKEYKATRKGMPDDLAAQVGPLKDLLAAMKIATCSKTGFEADDIIGTLSKKFDVHSYIYTGDRDSFQLVDEKTDVHYTKRGVSDLLKLNINNFKDEIGLTPSQIVDLKALMGDSSDNIPGVPAIGDRIAHGLLERFGTLDGVYANLDKCTPLIRSNLEKFKETAYMSYTLATIDRECSLNLELEDCVAPSKYGPEVKQMFAELEFGSFLVLDIFEDDGQARSERIYPEKIVCNKFETAIDAFGDSKEFAVCFDDNGGSFYSDGKLVTVKIAENFFFDDGVSYNDFVGILKHIFSNPENRVIVFGCKTILHTLKNYGVEFNCAFDDVQLAKYLCDYSAANLDLTEICNINLYDLDYTAFAVYDLFEKYSKQLKEDDTVHLYEDIEKPLLKILYEMEDTGVCVNLEVIDELAKRYEQRVNDYKQKVFEGCGCEFNINSPNQLGQILYEKLGLKDVKKKTGKYTTSADVLEKLQDESPVVGYVMKFRLFQKLLSTYLEGFKPLIDKKTGLVHTTYNQTITATGRLSSANPNLQNIPIREEEGRELRKLFKPREGNIFIDADYSQIELRLLAHFSGCKELVEAYRQGTDIHTVTASQVFGVPIEEVTAKMRRDAKAVNFGIIYGMSEFGLARNLDIPFQTARGYIEKYFETYSDVKEYMNSNVAFAKEHGYVSTLTGRKRIIPEINSGNFKLRQFGERAAMNMPLQGSSADIIKIAMINVFNALKKNGLKAKLILQVHDELVLDCPVEEQEKAAEILKYEMENAVKLQVPLTVDVHSGKTWYDAK